MHFRDDQRHITRRARPARFRTLAERMPAAFLALLAFHAFLTCPEIL